MIDDASRHGLGLRQVFSMTVGTIIGVGWITMLGSWLSTAGPLGAIVAFAGGALLILPIVLCYAELAAMLPERGGEMAYARAVAGEVGAFWAGWLLLLIFVAVMAFESVSTGWVIGALLPGLGIDTHVTWLGILWRPGEIAIGLIGTAIIAGAALRGERSFRLLQDWSTFGKLIVAAIFIVAGLMLGDPGNFEPMFRSDSNTDAAAGILAVLITTPFWFSGFNAAAQAIGERSRHMSLRGIGRTFAAAIVVSLAFYCLVIAAAAMAAPRAEILGHQLPVAGAFQHSFGPGLARVVLVAGLLGLISTWNAVFFAATRVVVVLAEENALPRWLARRSDGAGIPVNAIGVCALLGFVGPLFGRAVVGPVVNATGTCVAALFVVTCAALILLRRRLPAAPRPYRLPGGIPMAAIALLASATLVVLSVYLPYAESGAVPVEWLILASWLLVGGVSRWARRSQRQRSTQPRASQ